jgi:hypothetical protein
LLNDPVGAGVVESLARPGGNVTDCLVPAQPKVLVEPQKAAKDNDARLSVSVRRHEH